MNDRKAVEELLNAKEGESVQFKEAKNRFDFSGEICLKATMEDISQEAVEIFRSKWVRRLKEDLEKLSLLNRIENIEIEQLLKDIGAVTDKGITYAALILFGTAEALRRLLAQSEVIFEYRPSNRPGPAAAREEFREGFFLYFDKLWQLINLRNDKPHYKEGFFVFDIMAYNERVVREAILNAVSHREYRLSGSIFVKQFFDRLEIDSPGGFPHGITRENIMFRQAPRNRLIAEILARCGLVERAGQGMDLIYELCIKEAKALPDFLDSDEYIVRMRFAGNKIDEKLLALFKRIGETITNTLSTEELLVIYSVFHGKKIDDELTHYLPRLISLGIIMNDTLGLENGSINYSIGVNDSADNSAKYGLIARDEINGTISGTISGSLSEMEKRILKLLKETPYLTRKMLSEQALVSERTIQRNIKSLQDKNILVRVGSRKNGHWKVLL
ncbi:MAG: HTH domain-containing protein [Lachnospiraceae bacterium]|jgi:ATP-dependent DNA helicase RecG|nr:HTH domain-containing protein [Lachnospiraceae bacterium]